MWVNINKFLKEIPLLILPWTILLSACSGSVPSAATSSTQLIIIESSPAPSFTPILSLSTTPESTMAPTAELSILSTEISPIDGMPMVYVPEGDFLMGSPDGEGDEDEHPQHIVTMAAFWIDQLEISNAMYRKCVNEGGCSPPTSNHSYTRDDYYENIGFSDYPVIFINLNQANKYCFWAGRRVPTEAEWEKAARGESGVTYPWGNNPPDSRLANFSQLVGDTDKVGSYPQGASPYGALDMAGNVSEWVSDWYADYPEFAWSTVNPIGPDAGSFRLLRGGSWIFSEFLIRSAERYWVGAWYTGDDTGFRCVVSKK